jgi:hypothetical protein
MHVAKTKPLCSISILVALAACGGGGSDGGSNGGGGSASSTPQAATGFAQPTDQIRTNVLFSQPDGSLMNRTDDVVTTDAMPLTVRLSGGGQTQIYFRLDGTEYFAQTASGGDNYFLEQTVNGQRTQTTFNRQLTTPSGVVEGGYLVVRFPDTPDLDIIAGHIVYGFDTDPATIAAETGSATYTGSIRANGYQGGNVSSASGTITLNATFDSTDTVSGNFNLGSLSGMTGAENYTLNTGDISGNGFDGTISVVGSLQSGQTLQSATYDGNFYGADAEAVGGTIIMTIIDGAETPIYVQGAFVAD